MNVPVALVTGASGGMGRPIVRDLARTHTVHALGRNDRALAQLAADCAPATVHVHPGDLRDAAYRESVVAGLHHLDVLVHCAAAANASTLETSTIAEWEDQFAVIVVGASELTRLALPLLREAQATIVFITSGAATTARADNYIYTAVKHAQRGMADAIRETEYGSRIRVSTIAPGRTDTEMLRRQREQMGLPYVVSDYITPDSIARAVRFVVDAGPDVHLTDIAVRPRVPVK